jgi:hypothetical protein
MLKSLSCAHKFINMAHILARITGVNFDDIEMVLLSDAAEHAERGMNLEHLWKNADNADEVLFLFSADDLDNARAYINEMYEQALAAFPDFPKPEMTFLV